MLLTQLKGPAQILLPAQLPFALAGLAVVLGGMALARRLVGRGLAPLVAGLVLALDGLLIPHALRRTLEGQSHELAADAIAPMLVERFAPAGAVAEG